MKIKSTLLKLLALYLFIGQVNAAETKDQNLLYKLAPDNISANNTAQNFFQPYCGKPIVVEFFSYACYGCFLAESSFEKYLSDKPSNVEFKRIPVVFNRGWEKMAKMYYAYEQLGVIDEFHSKTFSWVQNQLKNRQPITDATIKSFIMEASRSADLKTKLQAKKFTIDDYMDVLGSITVNRDSQKGMRLFAAYQIGTTPSVVVNNKYVISLEEAKSHENMIKAINDLTQNKMGC